MLGKIKRGDTFSFTASLVDHATGEAVTGAGEKLRCHGKYRDYSVVLVDMAVTETDTAGTYLFSAGGTADWTPNKNIMFDIEYSDGGVVSSSETFSVRVEADITNG